MADSKFPHMPQSFFFEKNFNLKRFEKKKKKFLFFSLFQFQLKNQKYFQFLQLFQLKNYLKKKLFLAFNEF